MSSVGNEFRSRFSVPFRLFVIRCGAVSLLQSSALKWPSVLPFSLIFRAAGSATDVNDWNKETTPKTPCLLDGQPDRSIPRLFTTLHFGSYGVTSVGMLRFNNFANYAAVQLPRCHSCHHALPRQLQCSCVSVTAKMSHAVFWQSGFFFFFLFPGLYIIRLAKRFFFPFFFFLLFAYCHNII